MTHKVHPKVYRIGKGIDWDSRWLHVKKTKQFLEEDFYIRSFIAQRLRHAVIERVEIERFPGKIHIFVTCARPGLVIGRGGTGIEEFKKAFDHFFAKKFAGREKCSIQIDIKEVKNPTFSAMVVAHNIAEQIEKRIPFRRVLKHAISKVTEEKSVEGIKIEVSGRLDGADIARKEWIARGRLPRVTLRSDIDYAFTEAQCTYGKIGIKVWIYKGEALPLK